MSGGRRLIHAHRLQAITGRLHPKTAVRGKRPPNRSPSPALITRTLIALVPVQTESVRQLPSSGMHGCRSCGETRRLALCSPGSRCGRPMKVIHEGAGRCQVAVTGCGWLGAWSRAAAWAGSERLQSSIRSRWADQCAVRCSGAQSRRRPSLVWEARHRNELARAGASWGSGRGRNQVGGGGHCDGAMTFIALARPDGLRQRISPSRRP
jgi:hypothetical protein